MEKQNQRKWKLIEKVVDKRITYGAQGIMINHIFHIIGGMKNKDHWYYNDKDEKLYILHEIENTIDHHRIIRIGDKILQFGGRDWGNDYKATDIIKEYDLKSKQWNIRKDIRLPIALFRFGLASVLNNTFLLICGGRDIDRKVRDDIWIYSVKNKSFTKSGIKCPMTRSI